MRYRVDEPASARLYVDGVQRVAGASLRPAGSLEWYGKVGSRSLPARRYALSLVAVDRAGNRSRPVPAGHVRIRYVELASRPACQGRRRPARPCDHRRPPRHLATRPEERGRPAARVPDQGPQQPGRYRIFVTANGHSARAVVLVAAR